MRRGRRSAGGRASHAARIRLGTALVLGALLPLFLAGPAAAHPLGNFTVNRYAGLVLSPGQVRVDYVVDMAEIPTFQELPRIDQDSDGDASGAELARWARAEAAAIARGLALEVAGTEVPLAPTAARASLRPGQGGLQVLRLEATFTGPLPRAGRATFEDRNDPGRVGWREITVAGLPGVDVARASVPARSASDELRSYPQDLLSSPLRVTRATFSFGPGPGGPPGSAAGGASVVRPGTAGGLADLVSRTGGIGFLAVAVAVALGADALHAMAPGHGKALVATYLVGSGGRVRDAARIGVAVAAMHSASVLALGWAIVVVRGSFAPERAYPWLTALAGGCAAVLGAALVVSRLRLLRADPALDHGHPHGHGHPHRHGWLRLGHARGSSAILGPRRAPRGGALVPSPGEDGARGLRSPLGPGGLASLALAGGILPSPSALLALLASVALDRLAFGLALILAFSVGLAGTLVAVGVVAVRAREAVARRTRTTWWRAVPVASAGLLFLAGLAMTARGLLQG